MKHTLLILGILLFQSLTFAKFEKIYCGFSESADWPVQSIVFDNPGYNGLEFVYKTSRGDEVFVFLNTMLNVSNIEQLDMTLLIQSSQGGGFIEASARGLVESEQKWNGVSTQTPLQRQDGGLYFVRVSCGI